jgi:hypothetical protein
MVLMGMTLSVDDFARIGASKRAVALGWAAQFSVMPTTVRRRGKRKEDGTGVFFVLVAASKLKGAGITKNIEAQHQQPQQPHRHC